MCNKMLREFYQKKQLFTKYILYRYKSRVIRIFIMAQSRAIEAIKRTQAADGGLYITTNMNPEQGLVSSTYGALKQASHEIDGVGLDQNVSYACANAMSDPNNAIEVRGRWFFAISPTGIMKPFNSDGNSATGCNSIHLIG